MTEEDGRNADSNKQTIGDISHTNPYTNETFGGIYRRGPAVADGGAEPKPVDSDESGDVGADDADEDASSADADSADGTQTMGEIDHTPRDLNVNNVWDRGDTSFVPGDD